ncbi:hypothetical protein AMAG_13496, partial [Allomyces macrogynus ATCC 38327]
AVRTRNRLRFRPSSCQVRVDRVFAVRTQRPRAPPAPSRHAGLLNHEASSSCHVERPQRGRGSPRCRSNVEHLVRPDSPTISYLTPSDPLFPLPCTVSLALPARFLLAIAVQLGPPEVHSNIHRCPSSSTTRSQLRARPPRPLSVVSARTHRHRYRHRHLPPHVRGSQSHQPSHDHAGAPAARRCRRLGRRRGPLAQPYAAAARVPARPAFRLLGARRRLGPVGPVPRARMERPRRRCLARGQRRRARPRRGCATRATQTRAQDFADGQGTSGSDAVGR